MLALLAMMVAQAATPAPSPSPTPVYIGAPATHFRLVSRPLGFNPDGNAAWLVIVQYLDAQNRPTRIMLNSNVDYQENRGTMQWQPRMRFGQPSAIIITNQPGRLQLTVTSTVPNFGKQVAFTNPASWHFSRVVTAPLGPHMIQMGWFPREAGMVTILRKEPRGAWHKLAMVAGGSTYRDISVEPRERYRYAILRPHHARYDSTWVSASPEAPRTDVSAVSGKGQWLYFGTNPYDEHYVNKLDPSQVVDQAVRAGLHYVELRTAYGAYWEVEPAIKPKIDAIIDGLAAHGIITVGWTVPRQASYEDLLASVRTAEYRTPRGTRLGGLAIDLERGDEFMHDCPEGCAAIAAYVQHLREALGPKYTITSTIEDPYLEHLDNSKYPYTTIARYSDVLQPMAYWRMLSRKEMNVPKLQAELAGSYQAVQQLSGRTLPISIGGQTTPEGPLGTPPAQEITASLQQAKALGAIGECFFDWFGTTPDQWNAMAAYPW